MGYNRAMNRSYNTLFMLMSLDGKISTGSSDALDFDQDFPKIRGVQEGLQQYYDIEKTTDWFSFNTGRVMAKVGWNEPKEHIEKVTCSFVVVDNQPHLTELGVKNLVRKTKKLYIVTTNKNHPAQAVKEAQTIFYDTTVDLHDLFRRLKNDEGAERVTIQSGGEMNALLVREGLIDAVSIVIAPVLVGGRDTSTLIDGDSLTNLKDLKALKSLELQKITWLKNSYIHMEYTLNNEV